MDVPDILRILREQGNDTQKVEAKSAHGGFPENIAQTMSAFANTPGGGTILFGVDEHQNFAVVGVYDTVLCQQAASNTARNAVSPQITIESEVVSAEGKDLVVVNVPEVMREMKPVRVIKTGQAYIRMYDGDYPLSQMEEQIFIAQRGNPHDDDQPVSQATIDDLDSAAVAAYIGMRRANSSRFTSMDDTEVLIRTGVLTATGEHPSLAGILALGVYPQQYFPSLAVQASLHSPDQTERALDTKYITGPIPVMMEDCVDWVRRVTPTAIVTDNATGVVRDRPTYPPVVVRELIANALIHRDLSPASINQPVILRLTQNERMLISSPGGLFGVSVEGLGKTPSSLRNARLTEILLFTQSRGERVVERLGSGIPLAQQACKDASMPPPVFDDRGVRFTVFVDAHRSCTETNPDMRAILDDFNGGPVTIAQLSAKTGRSEAQVRYSLAKLVSTGRLVREPGDGRTNVYRVVGP